MSLWLIILVLTTTALFLLPILPGLVELVRRKDVKSLRVLQDYDSNPLHFAEGLRNYIRTRFEDIHSAQNHNGKLPDGTPYQLVGEKGIPNLDASGITSRLILSAHPLILPVGELFEAEVYGAQNILTGERSSFRSIFAENTLHIREYCTVLRWAHSEGEMAVARHSKLCGRATSKKSIVLGDNVEFERLHAPTIISTSPIPPEVKPRAIALTALETLPDIRIQSGRRWVLNGHLDFPSNHLFTGDIVTDTTASIGDYAHIRGSLKCNAYNDLMHHLQSTGVITRDSKKGAALCNIGNHVQIDGSVVSSYNLAIGRNCRIFGPVIAENLLTIGAGTVIGSPEHPTTVTAPYIIIEGGCTIHGTLWAKESGLIRDVLNDGAIV